VACLQRSSVDDIEPKSAPASSLQDALSRASESEKALRVLQLRVSELEASDFQCRSCDVDKSAFRFCFVGF